jgi:hypothetical protein
MTFLDHMEHRSIAHEVVCKSYNSLVTLKYIRGMQMEHISLLLLQAFCLVEARFSSIT